MANSLRNRDDWPATDAAADSRSEAPPAAITSSRARSRPGSPSNDAT